jgi:hypothetical protein
MRAKCARAKGERTGTRTRNAMTWNAMAWWAAKRVRVLREVEGGGKASRVLD